MSNITDFSPVITADSFYTPSMMTFDGSTEWYDKTYTASGNKVTGIIRFKIPAFINATIPYMYLLQMQCAGGDERMHIALGATDRSPADEAGKIRVAVINSTGTTICQIFSEAVYNDSAAHTVMFSFDGDGGTAQLVIDGSIEDDTGVASRVAPTTGTLETTTPEFFIGDNSSNIRKVSGDLGFAGGADVYITNWSDFMDGDGNPLPLDESTWTEWGGQPLFWNAYGDMENNLGSAGNMTRNGTITVGDDGTTGSSYTLTGTATAIDITAGKTAWVNGTRLDGTYEPPVPQGGRIFDDASQLYKSYTSSGNKLAVFLTLSGVVPNAANRRMFRVESPSGYSNLSIEVYASGSGIPNHPYVYQVNSSNTGILGAGGGYSVGDEGRYSIFFSSDRDLGIYTFAINGVQLYTASYNDVGTQQVGASSYIRFGSISGSQYLRSCIGSMMVAEQYMTNWTDFMDVKGNPKTLDTSGWTEWGGTQPLVYAPNGDLDTNNLGSLGAFTWSP